MKEELVVINNKARKGIKQILNTKELEYLLDQRGSSTQAVMIFMGIKSDMAVCESSSSIAPIQQENNNINTLPSSG
jgi:hypothetical protein